MTTTHAVEALLWLAEREFDAIVLGHSIPSPERMLLARNMKALKPDVPVVMVCRHGDNAFSKAFADARVGFLDGPAVLISAIRRLTPQQKNQSA